MDVQPRNLYRYITIDESAPFAEWLETLRDERSIVKIKVRLERVRLGNLGDHRSVGAGVWELRSIGMTTQNGTMPAKDSYHDYLIESLKDACHAAMYLEACLEETDPEPELLRQVLLNLAEALGQPSSHTQLDTVFLSQGSEVIYGLVNWLSQLGLKLSITVQEPISPVIAEAVADTQLVA